MVRLVDTHMHLWDLSRHYYAWLQDTPLPNNPAGDMTSIAGRNYLVPDYLADLHGVDVAGCVHVECGLPVAVQISETDWLHETAEAGGLPSAIVAGAVLDHPDVERHLAAQAMRPRVRGVRHIVNWHDDPSKSYTRLNLLNSAAWRRGFALLARNRLSFDMQIYPGQMAMAARLAARHLETSIIVNHAGMPTDRDRAGLENWREGMTLLAKQPNVSVKISGLAMVDRSWTAASVKPFIHFLLDAFGPDRCMFGSNFPVDRTHGRFQAHLDAFLAAIEVLDDASRALVLEGTARHVYRLS